MKVTVVFDSEKELEDLLSKLKRLDLKNKGEIEALLSSNLAEALNSPYLGAVLRRKALAERRQAASKKDGK